MDRNFNIREHVKNGLTDDIQIQANFTQINRMVFLLRKTYKELFDGTLLDVLTDVGGLLHEAFVNKLLTSEQLYTISGAAQTCVDLLNKSPLAQKKLQEFYCSDLKKGNRELFRQLKIIDDAGINVTFLNQVPSQKPAAKKLFENGFLDPQPKGIGDMTEYDMFTVAAKADVPRYQLIQRAKNAGILHSGVRNSSDKPNDYACNSEQYPEDPCRPLTGYFCSLVPGSNPPVCTAASDIWEDE
jgi:uncharacterized protein YnzC (UPF0291/DUF896 family)